jgi:mono/diheme cytochrome c family protein
MRLRGELTMYGRCIVLGLALLLPTVAHGQEPPAIAAEARAVLQQNCVRCHHGKGSEGGDADFSSRADLVKDVVKPGDVAGSLLLKRIIKGEMPPEGEQPRPNLAEIDTLWQWIEAKAPEFPKNDTKRKFITLESVLSAVRDHLKSDKVEADDRPNLRFFTLHTVANNAAVTDAELRLARAALSKALNSLSRGPRIVVPTAVDAAKTVFAIDVTKLGWKRDAWIAIEKEYPYGLGAGDDPARRSRQKLEDELRELTGCVLPVIRADWFVATGTRPPLYHTILDLPTNALVLERDLGVDIASRFLHPSTDTIARAGFPKSGVSGQNRMVERCDTKV